MTAGRRCQQGAEWVPGEGTYFRVWAPERQTVELVVYGASGQELRHPMVRERSGHFAVLLPDAKPGTRYKFRIDGEDPVPDPAAKYQPEGPHGPSEVVDATAYRWHDGNWQGLPAAGHVIYELHIGTFTPEGTFAAARARLAHLRDLGVTVVELMPIAEFAGTFGWSYDGVDLYAPYHGYGSPDDLRAFIDHAHALGLGVILDVVYNHAGPDGFYLSKYSPHYEGGSTEWGPGFNFDGPHSQPVRDYFTDNVAYWMRDFHFDGLRIDAAPMLIDTSPEHILNALVQSARQAAAPRQALIIVENEAQDTTMIRPTEAGGAGADLTWNDDFHHSAIVAMTGRREAYYTDYRGTAQEMVSSAKYGFLFQGQHYVWQKKPRGLPTRGRAPYQFVNYLENHDQVANSHRGLRLWMRSQPAVHRAMTALLLLGPWTPHLLQGQEWNATTPFLYFADLPATLAASVSRGRAQFLAQFKSLATSPVQEHLPDPASAETFARSKLVWEEVARTAHTQALALHRDLIELRGSDVAGCSSRAGAV